MSTTVVTPATLALRAVVDARRAEFDALLAAYKATNPRFFGPIARGDAREDSDIGIIVEMHPADGNIIFRAGGLMEDARALYERDDIDIFSPQLLKERIAEAALAEAVAL